MFMQRASTLIARSARLGATSGRKQQQFALRSLSSSSSSVQALAPSTIPPGNDAWSSNMTLLAGLSAAAAVYGVSSMDSSIQMPRSTTLVSQCEATKLSAAGIKESDINELVKELLKDSAVNITLLPDTIEAQLYKSTILLTLNALYYAVANFQGTRIFSHEIHLSVDRDSAAKSSVNIKALVKGAAKNVDDEVLRQVADRLIADPVVNSPWIPDALEHQIYFACLQVVFRILYIALGSLSLQLLGHSVRLQLAPTNSADGAASLLETAALDQLTLEKSGDGMLRHRLGATPVDLNLLRASARQAGVDDETNTDWWWNRIFTRSDFVEQLHVSLYGLILGILDEIFANVEIKILSDSIQLDLVPCTTPDETNDEPTNATSDTNSDEAVSFAAASFAAGLGMGVTIMAVLANAKGQ
eukprot:Nitzschia sp. Nitz4//scaffold18_size181773//10689//12010//NITZ4_001891-RA/size181773-snap-gene-0.267-mRNA-1//-1//CDS//3329539939//9223//frame0